MKILHVYKTFLGDNYGGVEQVIAQIARSPQNKAIQHHIVSLSPNPIPAELDFDGFKNSRYKENANIASNSISFSLLKNFRQITQDCDLIHYHFPWPFADILHLFWNIKKPAIITYHSDIVRQKSLMILYRPVMQRFLSVIDCIVATSPNYFATSRVLQQFKDKVKVIPIGLDKSSYPTPDPQKISYWQEKFGQPFFLFIGVLRYYKGLHILLNAAKGSSFPIVIVGTGPIEEELKAQAKALQLDNIHFLGRVEEEDKIALLHSCLSLVFPSHIRSEAFGVSLLEGAMFGKPLISADIGTGTSFINQDGETGLVVPPEDANALRKAMEYLWEFPTEAKQMGEQALARFEKIFTADKMVKEYEEVYQATIHARKG